MLLEFLASTESKKDREELVDRIANELHVACETRAESKEVFTALACAWVNDFYPTLRVLRERTDPSSELGAKLRGADLSFLDANPTPKIGQANDRAAVAQHIFALLNNPLTPAHLWEYIAQFVAEQTSGDFSERLLHSAATLDQLLQGMKPKEFIGERASMTN